MATWIGPWTAEERKEVAVATKNIEGAWTLEKDEVGFQAHQHEEIGEAKTCLTVCSPNLTEMLDALRELAEVAP